MEPSALNASYDSAGTRSVPVQSANGASFKVSDISSVTPSASQLFLQSHAAKVLKVAKDHLDGTVRSFRQRRESY